MAGSPLHLGALLRGQGGHLRLQPDVDAIPLGLGGRGMGGAGLGVAARVGYVLGLAPRQRRCRHVLRDDDGAGRGTAGGKVVHRISSAGMSRS